MMIMKIYCFAYSNKYKWSYKLPEYNVCLYADMYTYTHTLLC